MKTPKHFTLLEHASLFVGKSNSDFESCGNDIGVPAKVFEEIEQFVLENGDETSRFLIPSYRKGLGKTLKAQQFVGVIETRNGTVIEILPKTGDQSDPQAIRRTFMKMLKELRHSPFKHFDMAHLDSNQMNLLEIFISMFLEELTVLVKRGIKSDYISREENSNFLKGRLKISEHLRQNLVHKERFYVEFDEYQHNRIENRIIKSTLHWLYKRSSDSVNIKRIREYIFVFEDIEPVFEYKQAFAKVKLDRQMQDYQQVLHWCQLFLNNESFSSFKGNSVAFALLFDMNKVFEDYVAHCLRREHPNWKIETQVREQYLLSKPQKEFQLKPDLRVSELTHTEVQWLGDTKWKILDSKRPHQGISQSDLYQMYAYGHKYGIKVIKLIYPKVNDFPRSTRYEFEKDFLLEIHPFDCEHGKLIE